MIWKFEDLIDSHQTAYIIFFTKIVPSKKHSGFYLYFGLTYRSVFVDYI